MTKSILDENQYQKWRSCIETYITLSYQKIGQACSVLNALLRANTIMYNIIDTYHACAQ